MKLIGGNINNLQQINVHFPREKKIRNKNTLNHKYFENFTKFTKDIQNQKKSKLKLFQSNWTALDIIIMWLLISRQGLMFIVAPFLHTIKIIGEPLNVACI